MPDPVQPLSNKGMIDCIHIAGAGRMGQGIALSFIFAGVPAVLIDLKDRDEEERAAYFGQIRNDVGRELQAMAALGLIDKDQVAPTLSRLTCVDGERAQDELAEAGLVFEAVPEVMDLKKETFAWLDNFIYHLATIPGIPNSAPHGVGI